MAAPLQTPRLDSDGKAEAVRIATARARSRTGDAEALARLDSVGPSVARAGKWRTRASLRTGTLMLWRIVAEDGRGLPAGSMLAGAIVDDDWRRDERTLLEAIESMSMRWRELAASIHLAFVNARLARERAIEPVARQVDASGFGGLFQPGLFERRDERAHKIVVAAQAAAEQDHAERLAAIEQRIAISFLKPRLILALTP
jgi:hypothetical protein